MKITKQQLKQIIKEEISKVLSEEEVYYDTSTKGVQDILDQALRLSREGYQGEINPHDVAGFLDDFVNYYLDGKDIYDEIVQTIEAGLAKGLSDEDLRISLDRLITDHFYKKERAK